MKLSSQVLRSRSARPLNLAEFLDLSNLELVSIDHLHSCPSLQTLLLRGNRIEDAGGLDSCQQLWHVDLSNNQLRSVEGLSLFLALGTLVLSNNNLGWPDLVHLRHMHILNLSIHGNPQLENDPYYRIHVIDCLPNVWILDGRLITSAERIQVKQFFQDSALTERPVRRKLKKDGFIPSSLKKIDIDGVFGKKTVRLMTTFSTNAVLNIETDWKRLAYLAQNIQEDIVLELKYTSRNPDSFTGKQNFLVDLFNARLNDRERCNMVLLLLVASLEFVLPTHLVRDTLDTGKLLKIGSVNTMDLFLLPRAHRCKVVSLLVSAVRGDRDENEDGGLYPKLYLCLYHMVSELTRLSETTSTSQPGKVSKFSLQLRDYKCLLATEVVQLMCIVPSFFDYLDRDVGVMNLVRIATADADISERLAQIAATKATNENLTKSVFQEMADFLLMRVQEQLQNLTNKTPRLSPCDKILSKSGALPMKGEKTPVCKAEYLVRGVGSPDDDPPLVNPRKMSAKSRSKFPHLGDKMLLGPQTVGKIISLPQPTMALVIIDAVPVPSGAVEHKLKESDNHYTYVNMSHLTWDAPSSMWKPLGTIGDNESEENEMDRFTLQASEDFVREVGNGGQGDDSFRPGTPESGITNDYQGLRASTPLIYTPRQRVFVPPALHPKSKARRPQRPLSSVYKEKLKLSLDLSRRAQSAGTRRPFTAASHFLRPPASKSSQQVILGPAPDGGVGMRVDLKGMAFEGQSDSARTLLDTGIADRTTQRTSGAVNSLQDRKRLSQTSLNAPTRRTTDGSEKGTNKENLRVNGMREGGNYEPTDGQLPEPNTAKDHHISTPAVTEKAGSEDKGDGGMSREVATRPLTEGTPRGQKTYVADPKSLQYTPHTVMKSYPGHQLAGRSRPVSAMEHQGVMMPSGRGGSDSGFHTEFQQQRINAWRRGTRPTSQPSKSGQSVAPPPPQRPTSPTNHEQASTGTVPSHKDSIERIILGGSMYAARNGINRRVPRANLWLAGGRDLFWEDVCSRPKSGHTPGWKEGLPDNMKRPRPKSAAARIFRRSKTPSVMSPSSHYETHLHGGSTSDASDFPDLSDYAPTTIQLKGASHRHGTQRGPYDEDPLPGPLPEDEKSPLVVWSYQRPYTFPTCLPCLYEHYLDDDDADIDAESRYTPMCNTPEPGHATTD